MHLVEASPDTKKQYQESARDFSEDDLMRMLHIVSEAQYKIKEAHQPKIQFEITLLKLIHMERTENLNTLLAELRELKKKLNNQPEIAKTAEEASSHPKKDLADLPQAKNNSEPNGHTETSSNSSTKEQTNSRPREQQAENQQPEQKEVEPPSENKEALHPTETIDESPKKEQIEAKTEKTTEVTDEEDELSNLFGNSSLGQPTNPSDSQPEATAETATETAPKRAPKDVSLEEISAHWEAYIDDLRQHVPQMLYFQMQRVDPIKLKNGALLLRCNDDFAKKIVEENKRRLGKLLEDHIGAFLNLSCTVQKDDSDPEESMSPYERFKKLQKRDPKIKKLVELFGAELDYNLNR